MHLGASHPNMHPLLIQRLITASHVNLNFSPEANPLWYFLSLYTLWCYHHPIFLFLTKTCVCCSALMDCVGCEKCRLWGKLQVLGLGTALKILFSVDGQKHPDQPVSITYIFFYKVWQPCFQKFLRIKVSFSLTFIFFYWITAAVAKKWSDCTDESAESAVWVAKISHWYGFFCCDERVGFRTSF